MAQADSSIVFATTVADFGNAPALRVLQDRIERLDISADAKALLLDLGAITLNVGGRVLAFGRKLLAIVFELASKFQNVMFGVIIALVLSAVLASIPLLGPAISALLTPLMLIFGIVRGSIEDFRNSSIQTEIEVLKQRMSILSAHAAQ